MGKHFLNSLPTFIDLQIQLTNVKGEATHKSAGAFSFPSVSVQMVHPFELVYLFDSCFRIHEKTLRYQFLLNIEFNR